MANTSTTKKLVTSKSASKKAQTEETEAQEAQAPAKQETEQAEETKTEAKKAPAKKPAAKSKTKAKGTGDLITETSKEIENLTSDQAWHMVENLQSDSDFNNFKLGGALAVIQEDDNIWEQRGYSTFRECIEAEFGIKYRKAMVLISIYRNLVEAGIQWDKVKDIGWTKLNILSPILDETNVDDWKAYALNCTTPQLKDAVKEAENPESGKKKEAPTEKSDVSTMSFSVYKDQKENINSALEKAQEECGSESKGVLLDYISLDYLGSSAPKKTKTAPFDPTSMTVEQMTEAFKAQGHDTVFEALEAAFPYLTLEVEIDEAAAKEAGVTFEDDDEEEAED